MKDSKRKEEKKKKTWVSPKIKKIVVETKFVGLYCNAGSTGGC
jgi:hypothetical protein